MVCPKCNKMVSSEDYNCIYCGTQLKSRPAAEKNNLFGIKKNKDKSKEKNKEKEKSKDREKNPKNSEITSPAVKKGAPVLSGAEGSVVKKTHGIPMKIKFAALCVLTVILIVLVVILIHSITGRKGERYAEIASEYIGKSVGDLNKKSDCFYSDNSEFYGVNTAVVFDSLTESDKSVTVQGVKYPEWAVFLKLSDAKFITDVTYTDFSVLKKDIRGTKSGSLISLERFHDGDKQSSVLKEIDISPYSISYSQSGLTTYTYKYYYKRDNDDEQAVLLRVVFSESGLYKYSSTELLIQDNM